MIIKEKIGSKNFFLISLAILFTFICIYFASFASRYSYIGISADFANSRWVIGDIHNGGEAYHSNVSVGDEILEIDNQESKNNVLLNKMLIVEQATSITVMHQNQKVDVPFKKTNKVRNIFFIFGILSVILFLLSSIYFKRHEISKTSQRYHVFLFLTSIFLISIIPSSMGNFFARFILIIYITLFPFFINVFWKAATLNEEVTKFSMISRITIVYSLITTLLFVYSQFFDVPLYVVQYLSRYIFYISLVFLVALLFVALYRSMKARALNKLNIIVSVILGLSPLFIGYVFPFSYEVPVIYTIPLLIFPIITIVSSLITNRLTNIRFHLPSLVLYILVSLIVTINITCLYLMTRFLPDWLIIVYIFLLTLSSIPILKDILILNSKTSYSLLDNNSIFSAVEAEREEISIYLHDTIIQDVIYHKRQFENLELIPKDEALGLLDDVIFELRELCSNIYPLMIKELGLKNAILDVIDKFQKKEPIIIKHQIDVTKFNFENNINNFILRSIREIINNSIFHGNAKNIRLHLYETEHMVNIEIIDDGYFGIVNDTSSSHFGLNVISEKLSLLGGKLTIDRNPTTVMMCIPRKQVNEL